MKGHFMDRMASCFLIVACALAASAAPASTAVAYMTGSENPWGLAAGDFGSPEAAMVSIYGVGGYTRYQGFDAAAFNDAINSFIYIEGSERAGQELIDFIGANPGLLDTYLSRNGRIYLNAALTGQLAAVLPIAMGLSLTPGASDDGSNPGGPTHKLAINGAGISWQGLNNNPFSTHVVSGLPPLGTEDPILGSAGPNYLWTYSFGGSYLFVGSHTAPAFHSPGGVQLRINLLCLANGSPSGSGDVCGSIIPPVPEPATWAMLIAGFGMVGTAMRRRRYANGARR